MATLVGSVGLLIAPVLNVSAQENMTNADQNTTSTDQNTTASGSGNISGASQCC